MIGRKKSRREATTSDIIEKPWSNLTTAEKLFNINVRLEHVEDFCDDVGDIAKLVKRWGAIVVTAAVSSGIVSGRFGEFLRALFANL